MGADTPIATVDETVDALRPVVAVIAAQMESRLEPHLADLVALSDKTMLAIGGRGTDVALAERLGAVYLAGGPVEAAEALTQRSTERSSA